MLYSAPFSSMLLRWCIEIIWSGDHQCLQYDPVYKYNTLYLQGTPFGCISTLSLEMSWHPINRNWNPNDPSWPSFTILEEACGRFIVSCNFGKQDISNLLYIIVRTWWILAFIIGIHEGSCQWISISPIFRPMEYKALLSSGMRAEQVRSPTDWLVSMDLSSSIWKAGSFICPLSFFHVVALSLEHFRLKWKCSRSHSAEFDSSRRQQKLLWRKAEKSMKYHSCSF